MNRTIAVIGLGLIGGSLAKAIKDKTEHTVYGMDISPQTMEAALEQGVIDAVIDKTSLKTCDMVILALYPDDTITYIKSHMADMKKGAVIIDCAGVKGNICMELSEPVSRQGLYFVGGHPMAGIEKSGFEHSFAQLFDGAPMVLCKDPHTNLVALKAAERFFLDIGFAEVTITTPDEHDRVIAFTSQLAHIVSNAYVKSDTAKNQKGFSAGSYKDLTRVAQMDANMWSELFFQNKTHLLREIRQLIQELENYCGTMEQNDRDKMKQLLQEGSDIKEVVG